MKRIVLYFLIALSGIFSTIQAQQVPSVIWKKCFGGSLEDKANCIIPALDGGFLVAGSSKSNDGDLTAHHGSTDSTDAWIFKISPAGELEWQKSYGGDNRDEFVQVIATADGNYLAVGNTRSKNGDVTSYGYHKDLDIWVVKLDRHGNILWETAVGGRGKDSIRSVKNTMDGGYVFIGSTTSIDGDIYSGNQGGEDILLFTFSPYGSLELQYCFGGTGQDNGLDVVVLPSNEILLAYSTHSQDGDFAAMSGTLPMAGILHLNALGEFISNYPVNNTRSAVNGIKMIENGSFLLTESIQNCVPTNQNQSIKLSLATLPGMNLQQSITYDYCLPSGTTLGYETHGAKSIMASPDGQVILAGTTDDPALPNQGNTDGFHARTDWTPGGGWKKTFGGSGADYFSSLAPETDYSWLVAGSTNSTDGDVSGNHGDYDCWIIKFNNFNTIKGTVYADYNLNGTKDANEPFLNNILVQSQRATTVSSGLSSNGIFNNIVDTGSYSTNVVGTLPYYQIPAPQYSSFLNYSQQDSLSFALKPIIGKRDYQVSLFAVTPARPGLPLTYKVQYKNAGTDTLQNRIIKLVKDSRIHVVSVNPVQASVLADTITWQIGNLLPRDTGTITIELTAETPPVLNNLDNLITSVSIDTTGDLNHTNNFNRLVQTVTDTYDPHDKQETRGGTLLPSDISNGEYLTYTIRFQNTGPDTAFNIIVKDTLDTKLDAASFEMVSASHPYNLSVRNGNILVWSFRNILLEDSIRNEPLSHGYLTYRVKPKSNLAIKDSIRNSASVFFDFNLPAQTNTQLTVVRVAPPQMPVVSGLQQQYCSLAGIQKVRVTNLPATGGPTTAQALLNNQAVTIAADSTISFDPATLPGGNNTLKITFDNPAATRTQELTFKITLAAYPEVNLQSNITYITSLTAPIILTATNTSGGGTSPYFTFAKDRSFLNVLQEGASAQYTLNAAGLKFGNTWIYIRMKTNETCFGRENSVDSIRLFRDLSTGITDPEFPGQLIQASPNPFRGFIRVNGLNSGKSYTLVLNDAQGRAVLTRQVIRRTNMEVPLSINGKGIYLLSIYDDRKKQLIGTITLLRE